MTPKELKQKFNPANVMLGVLKDGDVVPCSIQNNSDYDILGFRKSCGCVGDWKATGRMIEGNFPAKYKASNQELFLVDGKYCTAQPSGDAVKYFDVENNKWVDEVSDVQGPFKAHQFTQNLTVKMKQDGVSDEIPDINGELIDNPERLRITIPITAWILSGS